MRSNNPLRQPVWSSVAHSLLVSPVVHVTAGVKAVCAEMKSKLERQRRLFLRSPPKALPARRKRRLSLPLADPVKVGCLGLGVLQETHSQDLSPLFAKLPLEIREMIWIKVVGNHWCYISIRGKKVICRVASDEKRPSLDLLKTCRRIYSEAIGFLYSRNRFLFSDLGSLHFFHGKVLPDRYSAIRDVRVRGSINILTLPNISTTRNWMFYQLTDNTSSLEKSWNAIMGDLWGNAWIHLAEMDGLRVLHLDLLMDTRVRVDSEIQRIIYRPMQEVSQRVRLSLRTQWSVDRKVLKELSIPVVSVERHPYYI